MISSNKNRFSSLDTNLSDIKLEQSITDINEAELDHYMDDISTSILDSPDLVEQSQLISKDLLETFSYDIEHDIYLESLSNESLLSESTLVGILTEDTDTRVARYTEKINTNIDNTIKAIKAKSAKTNNIIKGIIESDKEKYKDYVAKIKSANYDNFIGIKNFRYFNSVGLDKIAKLGSLDSFKYSINMNSGDIRSWKATNRKAIIELSNSVFTKSDRWKPSNKDITYIINYMTNSSVCSREIAASCKEAEKKLNKLKSEATKAIVGITATNAEDRDKKMNELYRTVCVICIIALKSYVCYKNCMIEKITSIRSAFLSCAKYANSKSIQTESVEDFDITIETITEKNIEYILNKLV